jgi:hypothetical protein
MVLAAGRAHGGKFEVWRRFVVRLAACVFLFQTVALFAAPPHPRQIGAAMQSMADCPHHRRHQQKDSRDHGESGCPMCQALGCALEGAVALAFDFKASERLIGQLRIVASAPSRATPRLQSASPRGPPIPV